MAATGPATVTPQQVAVDRGHHHALGGVGVALGVIPHLLVGPGPGPLHPGGKPVDAHRPTGGGHLHQPIAQISQAGGERAIGLAHPERGQFAQQQGDAVADLGLGDPHHPAGPPVRQPVQHNRTDRVQTDLQRQRRGPSPTRRPGWEQVGQPTGQPGQHLDRQRRTRAVWQGARPPGRRENLAYGLAPCPPSARASRTPSMTCQQHGKTHRSLTCEFWSWRRDSNPEPAVYKTAALPVAPRQRMR